MSNSQILLSYIGRGSKCAIEDVNFDFKWGVDHGVWCVLSKMYTNTEIPLVELSINRKLSMRQHYKLGKKLYKLREEGILIFAPETSCITL